MRLIAATVGHAERHTGDRRQYSGSAAPSPGSDRLRWICPKGAHWHAAETEVVLTQVLDLGISSSVSASRTSIIARPSQAKEFDAISHLSTHVFSRPGFCRATRQAICPISDAALAARTLQTSAPGREPIMSFGATAPSDATTYACASSWRTPLRKR